MSKVNSKENISFSKENLIYENLFVKMTPKFHNPTAETFPPAPLDTITSNWNVFQ